MSKERESLNWVSPPGETITDLLEEKDWTQLELAGRLGYNKKHLNQLIKGKAALTEDAALRLERVLGSTANFWLNREAKYREHLARIEQIESNHKHVDGRMCKIRKGDFGYKRLLDTTVLLP